MDGRATLTMLRSRITMNCATQQTVRTSASRESKARRRRRVSWSLSVGGGAGVTAAGAAVPAGPASASPSGATPSVSWGTDEVPDASIRGDTLAGRTVGARRNVAATQVSCTLGPNSSSETGSGVPETSGARHNRGRAGDGRLRRDVRLPDQFHSGRVDAAAGPDHLADDHDRDAQAGRSSPQGSGSQAQACC